MNVPVETGAALAVALAAVETLKFLGGKLLNGKGAAEAPGVEALERIAESLASLDKRTAASSGKIDALWEAHKPQDGRYRWWFPPEMIERQDEILKELRKIGGHLATIERNGRGTRT